MKTTIEKEANNIVKMEIEIDSKRAQEEYNKAVSRVAQYVNIDGFRKGKAPKTIVEQHVGSDRIKHEALESLLPEAFRQAIDENKLDVISQPYVESYDFDLGKDIKVVAKVELRPEVKLGQYKDLKLSIDEYKVPADSFDKSLEALVSQHATTEVVKGRKTKNTDVVTIDFDGYVNGEKIKGGEAKDYPLDLANSNFIQGFAEQLVGHETGEEFDINVTFPENYHEEKLKGAPAIFKIKIKEIKEKKLPEVNDEFAKKVGPFKTVEELNADINKYLETQEETQNKKNTESAIFNKVLENAKVDIQDTLIEREVQSLMEEYRYRMTSQGLDFDKALEAQGKAEVEKSMRSEAESRIKNSLVIDKIAHDENLKVEPADLEKKIADLGKMYNMDRSAVLKQIQQSPEIINSLSQQVLNEKVTEFLAANNEVTLKPAKKAKASKE